uniref:Elongation of very long chain fatty acids protein n=1 Tax=Cacopsylla melanoneura TaxID=428564 RepID=A0A8D8UYL8_9HEMI
MATIIESISNYYLKMENYADPRVKNWFFMSTPIPTILLVIVYNVGVLSIGPRIMAKRKPLELKTAIMLYNIGQILLNSFFVFQRAGSVWLFFMSRLFDLVDTVFFVLRKKQSQVTFLHVYHHTVVALFGWMGTKFVPGGHGVFFGTINSFVHVVMYSYYSLALINPEYKNAWWKKYLTQMQMIQFVAIGLHAVAALFNPNCNYPKSLIMLALPQNIFMFVLFADFYRKTYIKPMDKTKKA